MEAIFTVAITELVRLTLLALFLERALALVFESKFWVARLDGRGLSPLVAFGVALAICASWKVDVISAVATAGTDVPATYRPIGGIITAMIIAGGSKLTMAIWQTVRQIKREVA